MNNHENLVDNEDSKSSVDNEIAGESTEMCSYRQSHTCGNSDKAI
jgi:hypothetical protein